MRSVIVPRIKAEKYYNNFLYMHDSPFLDKYYELYPLLNDNQRFLFSFGVLLRNLGRYNDSNAILRQGQLLSADPMFYILMGRNYEDMYVYNIADSLYQHAFYMVPNRIYPLYRQMKLYENMGDSVRCKKNAFKVQKFRVKINSPATEMMQNEAKEILL